jgi:hypothetical protein
VADWATLHGMSTPTRIVRRDTGDTGDTGDAGEVTTRRCRLGSAQLTPAVNGCQLSTAIQLSYFLPRAHPPDDPRKPADLRSYTHSRGLPDRSS